MPEKLGRYELIARIGRGGMADVLLARDGGKLVVLKVLLEELAGDPTAVEMMRQEAQIAAKIEHPNVVDVHELGEADGQYFIAMEYLAGESLLSVIDRGITAQRLDPLSMTRIVADTAKGLAAAHAQGVVHHDISLGNIFVLYSGAVKLLDFGVAKDVKAEPAKLFGKLAYTAPEKLDARVDPKTGGARSDIWSLGCVLWEALTNKRLFKGASDIEIVREVRYVNVPPPSSVRREVPKELDAITLACLQREPARRHASARDLADALEGVLAAQGYPAKNYQIGAYMMQAFADVIAARERLLRESAGDNRPSADVIDAAFTATTTTRDSLPVFEAAPAVTGGEAAPDLMSTSGEVFEIAGAPPPISAAVALPEPEPEPEPEPLDLDPDPEPPALPGRAPPALPGREPPALPGRAPPALPGRPRRSAQRVAQSPAPPGAARGAHDVASARARRYMPLAFAGALVAAVVMIVAIRSCVGEDKLPPPAPIARPVVLAPDARQIAAPAGSPGETTVAPPTEATGAPTTEATGAPPTEVTGAPTTEATGAPPVVDAAPPAEIEMPLDEATPGPVAKPEPRAKPAKSAQKYYAEGLAAWKKNDARTAYALFTEGRRANATYANNWYGLGLVHDKAGRKKDARLAYERYMQLAPRSPINGKLREHIKKTLR